MHKCLCQFAFTKKSLQTNTDFEILGSTDLNGEFTKSCIEHKIFYSLQFQEYFSIFHSLRWRDTIYLSILAYFTEVEINKQCPIKLSLVGSFLKIVDDHHLFDFKVSP